jgi:hypothetical protein
VEEGGDRVLLVAPVLEHDGGHRQQMRHVGDVAGSLATLLSVELARQG